MAEHSDNVLVAVSVNNRSAPVELRERLAFRADRLAGAVRELAAKPCVSEAAILSTCNRVELYAVGADPEAVHAEVCAFLEWFHGIAFGSFAATLQRFDGDEAARHVFQVAGSLESMVLGETEILGQVKDAYRAACEAGGIGPVLRALFETAFSVAKAIRAQTAIGRARVSVASAAVDLAGKVFDRFSGRLIVVIGTGEMAAGIVEHLRAAGADRIAVTSRTPARAAEFAARFGAEPFTYSQIGDYLTRADIVLVGTTAPLYLLTREQAEQYLAKRRAGPLLLVDISVPRNVDPLVGELPNCYLFNIDDLQEIVDQNKAERLAAAAESAPLLQKGLVRYRLRLAAPDSAGVIERLREFHEAVRLAVLRSESARLEGLNPAVRERIERVSRRLVNKALHPLLGALAAERNSNPKSAGDRPLHAAAQRIFPASDRAGAERSWDELVEATREDLAGAAGEPQSRAVLAAVRPALEAARDTELEAASTWLDRSQEAEREGLLVVIEKLVQALAHHVVRATRESGDQALAECAARLYTHKQAAAGGSPASLSVPTDPPPSSDLRP